VTGHVVERRVGDAECRGRAERLERGGGVWDGNGRPRPSLRVQTNYKGNKVSYT